jgi:acetyl-CoA carboxylase biotin carboxyl carrier protein
VARIEVKSEVTGTVWKVEKQAGARVTIDDDLMILESMKMEIPVSAPAAGVVVEIRVAPEQPIAEGDVVAVIETD